VSILLDFLVSYSIGTCSECSVDHVSFCTFSTFTDHGIIFPGCSCLQEMTQMNLMPFYSST
jgi:hypothetical protein